MTRLLLALLVASNGLWLYVRVASVAPTHRHARSSSHEEAALRQRIEEAKAGLLTAAEESARREREAAELARTRDANAARQTAAGEILANWSRRFGARDAADAHAVCLEVRAGIRSSDPAMVLAAIRAAAHRLDDPANAGIAETDGLEPLRPLLLPFLESPDAELRYEAANALRAVRVEPADLPRLLALEGDKRLRSTLPYLLRQAAEEPVPAAVREVVLRLLDDKSTSVVEHTLAAWGAADLGPEYIERVIGLVDRRDTSRSAIEHVLGRIDEKPDRVVDVLLATVLSRDEGTSVAAIDGLKHEVRHRDRVAEFFLRLLQLRSNPHTQVRCLEVLERCGRQAMIPVLEAWAAEVEPRPWVRGQLDRTIAALRERP